MASRGSLLVPSGAATEHELVWLCLEAEEGHRWHKMGGQGSSFLVLPVASLLTPGLGTWTPSSVLVLPEDVETAGLGLLWSPWSGTVRLASQQPLL